MTPDTAPPTEYTPTTAEIREYVEVGGEPRPWMPPKPEMDAARAAAFDRWLAAHDREVAARALRSAADAYRSGALTGIFVGRDDYPRAWLRARATRIENGETDG